MDIYSLLGLTICRTRKNKLTQLVKHWDDVSDSGTYKSFHDNTFTYTKKMDGVHCLMVVTCEDIRFFSRTGKEFNNTHYLKVILAGRNLPAGVYSGELCTLVDCSLQELSGVTSPHRKAELKIGLQQLIVEYLHLWMFDYVSLEEFKDGYSRDTYLKRYVRLESLLEGSNRGASLIIANRVHGEVHLEELRRKVKLGEFGEGVCIRPDAFWVAGQKDWHCMKITKGVSYDLRCVGFEEGEGKYRGLVANLLFEFKGKIIPVMLGKGWTHEDARSMFVRIRCTEEDAGYYPYTTPIGSIFAVYALEETSKGKLRNPKVGEFRHDKNYPDEC